MKDSAAALADKLEVWGFEDDFAIFTDGSAGFCFEVTPQDITCKTDDGVNQISESLSNFLNGLPEDMDIQFLQEIAGGNEHILKAYEKLGDHCQNQQAKKLADTRIKILRDFDQNGELPVQTLKVFVRSKFSKDVFSKQKLFTNASEFESMTVTRFQREIEKLERLQNQIHSGLDSLRLKPVVISSEKVLKMMYELWNPGRDIKLLQYDPENVRDSFLFSDVVLSKKGFSIYGTNYRVISLKNLPDTTFAGMASELKYLPFGSKLILSVHSPNQQKEFDSLQTQRRVAFSLASKKSDEVADLEGEAKFADLESLLEELISNGEKVFYVSLNVVLQNEDEAELEAQVSETLKTIRNLCGAEGMTESYASFDIFSEMSIPNARSRERQRRMKTSNLADLLPVYGDWKGHALSPSVLFRNRSGGLLAFNPFVAGSNPNQLISGSSGAGKSFLANLLVLQILKEDPKVFFIDIGGSYQKLSENLGGQNIPLGLNQGITINPFDLKAGESTPSSEQIKFLVGMVELMVKEEDQSRLSRIIRAEIEIAIKEIYDEISRPKLSDLKNKLNKSSNAEVRLISKILETWCGSTPYGELVDRDSNINIENDIVAFDLKPLESFPDLQAVLLYLVTNKVWKQIQTDRSRIKLLVFDEAWALLKDDAACDFIESVFRTCRKYNTSAIALSQAIDDFANSKIAHAILPNCTVKWVMLQIGSKKESLREVLSLNEKEISLIQSLSSEKGKYSEGFLMSASDRAVVVVEATPIELWLSTTHPKDLALIEKVGAESPDLTPFEVLESLAKKYPTGAPE